MFVPIKYNLRNLLVRRTSTLLTVFGIGVSVAVFVSVMALVEGIRETFVTTGEALNVLAIRNGAQSETGSLIEPSSALVARTIRGAAKGADGEPLVSIERIVYVQEPRLTTGSSNIVIRGLGETGRTLRPVVHLVNGRWYVPGRRELTVSRTIAERFRNTSLGDELVSGRAHFRVVGIFEAGRSAYASEMWTAAEDIGSAFDRVNYSNILARAADRGSVRTVIDALSDDPRMRFDAKSERAFYAEQTKAATPVKILGNIIAIVMAVGSAFAAMNTMYAAVASRGREVAVLRALGFSRAAIAFSFVTEAVLLSIAGGIVGGIGVTPLNGLSTGTTNWFTFSEMNFAFAVTAPLFARGVLFAAVMGLAGGILPALRASRMSPATAMRAL
ncbi:MAG TPA: ABC transporter permease [Thermoanaerobaculia bacterium]|jgi:putative ABC transport system permease protein